MPKKQNDIDYQLDNNKRKLVEQHYKIICYIANKWNVRLEYRYEVEDLIQICSIGFIRSLKYFDPDKGSILGFSKKMMNNEVRNFLTCKNTKRMKRETFIEDYKQHDEYDSESFDSFLYHKNMYGNNKDSVETDVMSKISLEELDEILHKHKSRISETCGKIIKLIVYYSLLQSEIAKIMGISRQGVNNYIRKFRRVVYNRYNNGNLIA